MKGWTPQAVERANLGQKPPQERMKGADSTKEPRKANERNSDALEAQVEKRKDYAQRRMEAELSKLNAAEVPRYQVGKGESTLGTVRFFHLQPDQTEQLLAFAAEHFKAKPA